MHVFQAAADAWSRGEYIALATLVGVGGSAPRRTGARMVVYPDGRTVGTIGGGQLEYHVTQKALQSLANHQPMRLALNLTHDLGMCCGGQVEVYIEPIEPQPNALIFGAGHVGHATAPLLRHLGYQVTVVDTRESLATPERFPGCTLYLRDPIAYAQQLSAANSAVLVTTHSHKLDQDLVEVLLPKGCAWLGLIGSKTKRAKFEMRYRAAGMGEHLFAQLHCPVGLDLGAQTPAEIAVSIAAQLVATRRQSND